MLILAQIFLSQKIIVIYTQTINLNKKNKKGVG